jgi:hypothetical protein
LRPAGEFATQAAGNQGGRAFSTIGDEYGHLSGGEVAILPTMVPRVRRTAVGTELRSAPNCSGGRRIRAVRLSRGPAGPAREL